MTDFLRIRNWDKWQSYRKDRGQPPWIKIHRQVMRNIEWVSLSDTERGQLVAIWLLAADHNGVIPASPEMLQKLCFMSEKPTIKKFIELGFIESNGCHDDANSTPTRRQHVTPETETETETEERERRESSVEDSCPHQEIIALYHQILPECPKIRTWTETRRKKLKTRWREDKRHQSLAFWQKYFENVRLCFWFTGKNNRNWYPDLEWLVEQGHFVSVWEKKYLDKDS